VGAVGGAGGVGAGQLVQHPRGGSVQALEVVLRSSNHCEMAKQVRASKVGGGRKVIPIESSKCAEVVSFMSRSQWTQIWLAEACW
jgi:hypothetical protein